MRASDFVSEYRAAGKVSVAGTIKLGNQFKDTYEVVNTPISHLYEVRIDDSPRESYPSYYFYNKDTGACVGSFSINAMPDAADDASPIVRPGVQIVQPHMTLAPEVQGKGLGSLIYNTFLAGGNWLFATFDHSSGAGALWDRMATKGSNISVLYNFNSDTVVEPGTKQAQTAVRILGPKERFKNKPAVAEDSENYGGIQLSLEIEKDDEYVNDDDTDNQTIYVKATANGRELGHVLFTIDYDSQGMVLNPQDLEVEEKYRGQGVAETMYDYVKSKGYRIRRSGQQTDAGAAFWNKHKPGQNVWEQDELEEGWKDWVAGGAMALGAIGAQAGDIVSQVVNPGDTVYSIARQNNVNPSVLFKLNGFNNNTKLTPGQEVKVPDVYTKDAKPAAKPAIAQGVRGAVARANALKPVAKAQPKPAPAAKTVAPITGSKAEQLLMNTAIRSGITGTELAAFMAQMAHESDDFKSMKEYGGSLDFRKYDPKYAPKKAKTLGNKYAGDGNRFKGRGFIQITGRYNYDIAGKAIGVDLIKNPKLAESPVIAAKIAVWYWKLRVQPNVDNFNDVGAVTKPINPGLRGLEDRKENFKQYLVAMTSAADKTS
jgi:predicted chitinase/GNAT superfamily N-acetyltransferase/transposase-like protein